MLDKDQQADKARRAEERAKRAARKIALHAWLRDCGIPIKPPEQRAADAIRWQETAEEREALRAGWKAASAALAFRMDTLTDLQTKTGVHGDTLCAHALADCAQRWACDGMSRKGHATRNHSAVIAFAMSLHIWQLWRDAGIKNDRLVLDNLSFESRCEVEQVIADTFDEWEAAGRPGLDAKAIKSAYRFIEGWLASGKLEPIPEAAPAVAPSTIPKEEN